VIGKLVEQISRRRISCCNGPPLPRISNKATTQTDLIAQHSVQDGGLRLRLNPPYGPYLIAT
jgi:hypothetical protein